MRRLALALLVLLRPAFAAEEIPWLWDAALPPQGARHVATLTEHLLLKDRTMLRRGRQTAPATSAAMLITPVVHVEVDLLHPPAVPVEFHDEIVGSVLKAAAASTSGWVQLDYEARPSHRVFYRKLVHDIKMALPPEIKLSVTALAWWCRSNAWLDGLEADEIVPMFFRMGKDSQRMNQLLANSPRSFHSRCSAKTAGFAVQEPPPPDIQQRYFKVYWFDYRGWKGENRWPPKTKP